MSRHRGPSYRPEKTKRWQAVRLQALRRDDWRCVQCGHRGRLEVDHVVPVRTRPDLAFAVENLQTLCRTCHSRKTHREVGLPELSPERKAWIEQVAHLQRRK